VNATSSNRRSGSPPFVVDVDATVIEGLTGDTKVVAPTGYLPRVLGRKKNMFGLLGIPHLIISTTSPGDRPVVTYAAFARHNSSVF
jgi:hypothetical protein